MAGVGGIAGIGAALGALGSYLGEKSNKKTAKKIKKAAIEAENKKKLVDFMTNLLSISGGQGLRGFSSPEALPVVPNFNWGNVVGGAMQGAGLGADVGTSIYGQPGKKDGAGDNEYASLLNSMLSPRGGGGGSLFTPKQ